jgi:hypothetical protein
MQTKQGAVLESLRAVDLFLTDNAEQLGDVVRSGARQKLAEALAELDVHATNQEGGNLTAKGRTKLKHDLQRRLRRRHMRPIARIARSDLPKTTELEPLKMPKGRPTAAKLVALADGMAQAAAPFADTFIEAGLPPDFLERLKTASSDLAAMVSDRTQSRGKQAGATTGLKQKLSSARKLVHVLDAFVDAALEGNEPLLTTWESVKHVRKITPKPKAPAADAKDAKDAKDSKAAEPSTVTAPPTLTLSHTA